MAAKPIKTLATLLSRRLHLSNFVRFSTATFNAEPGITVGDVGNALPASHSRESVIYGLRKLIWSPDKALDLFRWVEGRSPEQLGETAYALMLRILAKKDWVKDFRIVLGEMTEKGIEMDEDWFKGLFSCLAKEKLAGEATALRELFERLAKDRKLDSTFNAAVEVIMGSEWGGEVEKKLNEIAFSVTDKMCLRMLRELKSEPAKALAFFRWAADSSNDYKHNTAAYNAMAKILAKNGLAGEFWVFVKEMKTGGFDIDYDTYVKISRSFLEQKMMKEAVELYEMMMAGPYKPAAQNCAEILRKFIWCDDVDHELVSRVLKAHESCGYPMTKLVYNGIHCALTGVGRFEEGEKIVQSMREVGFEPDGITYRQLVFGLCKFGKLEDAGKVLDEMEKLGFPPDVKTWTILIQGHLSLGEVDQAMAYYAKMIEKKCEADANLIQVLIQGLVQKNKGDEAYTMITELANSAKIRPLRATYKLLIDMLLRARKFEEALNALKLMKSHEHAPYNAAFVDYFSKFGSVQEAVEYFQVLKGKHYPTSKSYLHVFEAFLKDGRQSEAQDLLYKCPRHIRNHQEILKVFAEAKAKTPVADKKEQLKELL